MAGYVPSTKAEQKEMLAALGMERMEELFSDIPEGVRLTRALDLPGGAGEMKARAQMEALARKNTVFDVILRGAGAYDHYIPAIVRSVVSKEEFLTAYTPYQAEISQGILQSIFEFQTDICELTGMDVSNASVYDGASAAAEAAAMCRDRKRTVTLVAATAHHDTIATVGTYCRAANAEMRVIPQKNGRVDEAALKDMLTGDVASVYVQQPNFYGILEDAEALFALAHQAGVKAILGVNPISLGALKTPADCGADIAVGDGQPLGMPLSFGGPYLGFMAAKQDMMRKLPGRIVGQTVDTEGKRAFVLTLQAREQHIRREKAGSNICSNQALCALTASVYLAAMGPSGLQAVARQCYDKAHYFAGELANIEGFSLAYDAPFFHEFVTRCPVPAKQLEDALAARGVLCGLPVEEGILWCVTEKTDKATLDQVIACVREVAKA